MDDIAAPSDKQDIYDINAGRNWEGYVNFLEGTLASGQSHLEFMGSSYPDQDMSEFRQDLRTLEGAITEVQRFGALGNDVAGIAYQEVKPPAPGIESHSDLSFSEYRTTPSDVDPSTGVPLKP